MRRFEGKRILVTGGAGFIGSNLAIRLLEEGAVVTVVDDLVPELGGNLKNLEEIRTKIRFEKADISSETLFSSLKGCQFVFNLAGNVSHSDSMRYPARDTQLNALSQVAFLDSCRAHCPQAVVIYTSTRQIYGTPAYLPVDEKHPIRPVDINGVNKLAAEQYHSIYHRVHGLRTSSLRLSNTYGPRQLIAHARQGFIAWFLNRALLGETIELFGGGEQRRDFNYVDDVVEALFRAALTPACHGGEFNLSGEVASLGEVAKTLVELTGKGRVQAVEFPAERKKIDIGDYVADSARFRAASGWTPRVALREGLSRTVAFYQPRLKEYLPP